LNKAGVTDKYLPAQFTARCPGCQNDNTVVDQSLMDILQIMHYKMKKEINIKLGNSTIHYHNSHVQRMCRYGSYIAPNLYIS
jgi:hypothetical protein